LAYYYYYYLILLFNNWGCGFPNPVSHRDLLMNRPGESGDFLV
jgi:hypothetical protein